MPAADETEFAIPARRTASTFEQWLELPTLMLVEPKPPSAVLFEVRDRRP